MLSDNRGITEATNVTLVSSAQFILHVQPEVSYFHFVLGSIEQINM